MSEDKNSLDQDIDIVPLIRSYQFKMKAARDDLRTIVTSRRDAEELQFTEDLMIEIRQSLDQLTAVKIENLFIADAEANAAVGAASDIDEELDSVDERPVGPPSGYAVMLLMPAAKGSDFVGQMNEIYPTWVKQYGAKRARRIWISQAAQAVAGHWINRGLELSAKVWPSILRKPSND
ncbi:hypothetical protein CO652_07065 [Rhizobium sp. H4]|uniref:hypothetical protein n=1 Tax=Rhizobium sp. H4 TaxID=2035449 RepID=UPI000BEAE6A4|nr:hypothetical protein [Rhizobium sp. H4]PDV89376.1 hypothetical protein CO652_07065 [Rhizobium sp. H4]